MCIVVLISDMFCYCLISYHLLVSKVEMIEFALDCCLWYFFLLWLNYNSVHSGNVSSEDVTGRLNSAFEQVTNHLGVKIDDTFTTKTMQESEKLSHLKQCILFMFYEFI